MSLLGVVAAVVLIFAAGFGLTLLLWRGSEPLLAAELFGLSWFLGAGAVSVLLVLGGIVVIGGSLISFVTLACIALAAIGRAHSAGHVNVHTGLRNCQTWERSLCLLLLLPIAYFAIATSHTAIAWDGLLIWEFKARSAFLAGGALPASFFSDTSRLQFHPSYPLYLPLTELWVYLWAGDCNQTFLKLLFPIFYAAGIALLWAGVLRLTGRPWIGTVTALVPMAIPLMSDRGFGLAQGYADFVLASVYLAGVSALLAWRTRGVSGAWFVSVACTGLLPWIKQEGTILLGSMIIQAAVANGWRGWRSTLLFAAPGVITAGTWKVALWFVGVPSQEVFHPLTWENLVNNLPRLELILRAIIANALSIADWSLLWFLAPLALLSLTWELRRESLQLTLALGIPFGGYIVAYTFTRLDLAFHLATSLDRLILQISMIAALSLGLALGAKPLAAKNP